MRIAVAALLACVLPAPALAAQASPTATLDIYAIDTEGGQATLYVTPSGQTVLVDTGNPGGRDADRIAEVLAAAGVDRIDFLLLTHYHVDHAGGLLELAERVPIRHFVDHGPSVEPNEPVPGFHQVYARLRASARHIQVKPGDRLPVQGLDWHIVAAGGQVLPAPLPGAGTPNPRCPAAPAQKSAAGANDENAQSVGSLIVFGKFRTINLGDLLTEQELELVCPLDRIGAVDLYLTSHHGLASSGSEALLHALRPRVAIMNNGTRKGGSVQAFQILHRMPGLEDLWQLHWSHNAGLEHNAPGLFIANLDDPATAASVLTGAARTTRPAPHTGPAYTIKVSARADGSFTVTNTRNGFTKAYGPGR